MKILQSTCQVLFTCWNWQSCQWNASDSETDCCVDAVMMQPSLLCWCSDDAAKFREDLMNIARTTLSSKILTQYKDHFANLAVTAVLRLKVSDWVTTDQLQLSILTLNEWYIPSQDIGWEERLQNYLFCVKWDVKSALFSLYPHLLIGKVWIYQ